VKEIVVGVTGSIACYRACDLISQLKRERDTRVHVVMTQEAAQFVTPLTFQTLSGNKVYSDLFERPEAWDIAHTALSDKADAVLVYPATLNLIGKLAHGIADDLLTCLLFATRAPVIVAPAMNSRMYEHKINQENIAKLKGLGYEFVGPIVGELACRERGIGHIAEPAHALEVLRSCLKGRKSRPRQTARKR